MGQHQKNERVHQSRVDETHDANPVHGADFDTPWTPATSLSAPDPRPGMAQRWVRTSLFNEDDATNMAKSFQEGWKPRASDTVPDSFPVPTISHGKFAGCVGVHGLVLCEMPAARLAQRRDYYEAQANKQISGVENDIFREQKAGMPLVEHTRKSSVVRGRPKIADE